VNHFCVRYLIILLSLAACGGSLPKYDGYTTEPDPRNKEIVLGVGDVLSINVYGQPDLNTEATVRPDGTITMPLVGDLKAVKVTPSELKTKIKEAVSAFLKLSGGNEVSVAVKAWHSYIWTVQGEVTKAGVYTSDHFVTIAEALAMCGGLTRFARHTGVRITRRDEKGVRVIPIDYDAVASGSRPDMNIFVLPGDQIYVR